MYVFKIRVFYSFECSNQTYSLYDILETFQFWCWTNNLILFVILIFLFEELGGSLLLIHFFILLVDLYSFLYQSYLNGLWRCICSLFTRFIAPEASSSFWINLYTTQNHSYQKQMCFFPSMQIFTFFQVPNVCIFKEAIVER